MRKSKLHYSFRLLSAVENVTPTVEFAFAELSFQFYEVSRNLLRWILVNDFESSARFDGQYAAISRLHQNEKSCLVKPSLVSFASPNSPKQWPRARPAIMRDEEPWALFQRSMFSCIPFPPCNHGAHHDSSAYPGDAILLITFICKGRCGIECFKMKSDTLVFSMEWRSSSKSQSLYSMNVRQGK